ncbi:MAG TPA: sigma-70 family RNA polymerase sigma factor [Fimbriimonas sp.]|nr:sigma-70 family RNA polymerase sigma factor [Fimbriimonas sp.]
MDELFADAELQLARLRRGDDRALIDLRKRLYSLMLREAYSVLAQPQDAEDAVEQAFLRIWRFREYVPMDWSGAKKYILKVARNAALDQTRLVEAKVQKVELHENIEARLEEEVCTDRLAEIAREAGSALEKRIGGRHQRILGPVALRLSQPYTDVQQVYSEVAESLGTSSGYVRNIWSQLGQELKKSLDTPSAPPEAAVRELLRLIGTQPLIPQHSQC